MQGSFINFYYPINNFFYDDTNQLMMGYRDIAKRADPELTKLFKLLPRLTYGIREMPSYVAADAPAAYYQPGSLEAGARRLL